jgi:MFS family permease
MAIAAALMATSLFLFSTVNSFNAFTGLNLLEYFMQSLYSALLYAATPELFPAPVRGSASGLASTLGRLASVVAPVAAQTIYNPAANGVFYLAGGASPFPSFLEKARLQLRGLIGLVILGSLDSDRRCARLNACHRDLALRHARQADLLAVNSISSPTNPNYSISYQPFPFCLLTLRISPIISTSFLVSCITSTRL